MDVIREQNDLALLPEPRFIYTAPVWLRRFATAMLLVGAVIAGTAFVDGVAGGSVPISLGGAAATALCLAVLAYGRPTDWRAWINLAATADGLYLVGRARRVVFVPWHDVLELGIEQGTGYRGSSSFARLTLRLPEEGWARFGNVSGLKGTGPVRQYLVSALAKPGAELVAELKAFRENVSAAEPSPGRS